MSNLHPGFKAVQKKIEWEWYSKESAWAILANASRKASPKAKAKNPALKKVSMPKKGKMKMWDWTAKWMSNKEAMFG